MSKKTNIIKYTIMPKNEKDNYAENFKLSLTEFAKELDGNVLLAPLIIYNSELDIPMDMDESIEEYIVYSHKDEIEDLIRREEGAHSFRTLVLHGFDVSFDEVRDNYCIISRKNQTDICINTIQPIELDSNLTFYLYNDLDEMEDEEWEETKEQLKQDMMDYVDDFKACKEMSDQDIFSLLPFLFDEDESTLSEVFNKIKNKDKDEDEKCNDPISLPVPKNDFKEMEQEDYKNMIRYTYEEDDMFVAINKINDNLFSIEDDDEEVILNREQIEFVFEQYLRIKDKPIKK